MYIIIYIFERSKKIKQIAAKSNKKILFIYWSYSNVQYPNDLGVMNPFLMLVLYFRDDNKVKFVFAY